VENKGKVGKGQWRSDRPCLGLSAYARVAAWGCFWQGIPFHRRLGEKGEKDSLKKGFGGSYGVRWRVRSLSTPRFGIGVPYFGFYKAPVSLSLT